MEIMLSFMLEAWVQTHLKMLKRAVQTGGAIFMLVVIVGQGPQY